MAYSWEDTANEILKQKKIWNDATYEKNSDLANTAAANAAGYYDTLRQNGDGALADALQSRDYSGAQKYFDTYKNNKKMIEGGSYNRGQAIHAIVGQKKAWNDAAFDKNTGYANQASSQAQKVYNWMRDNGDAKTAETLSNMGYEAASKYQKDEAEKQGVVDSYDTKNALNLVMRLQTEADAAKERGDNQTANDLQWEVNRFLKLMGENGDGVVVSNFNDRETNSQKQQYVEKYMNTTGKTALRNYLYQAGAKFGLSNADIDKMISYDNNTGEITLAGVNIGKPDAVVDGVSYVSAEKAEQLAKDAFNRTGVTMSDEDRYQSQIGTIDRANNAELGVRSRQREEMEKKGNELWDEGKKNVTDSTDYKRIYDRTMSQYNLAALQGRDNAAAYNAASNSGNIDSYAAANAMRQQAAMTAYGQQVANELGLDAYKTRLDNLGNIFDKLGIEYSRGNAEIGEQLDRMSKNAQQVFENDETRKNNDVSRKQLIAETTGYAPDEWVLSNNHFLTDDGKIKPQYQNENFKNIINQAVANGDEETANQARVARAVKIFSDYSKWGQYDDGDYRLPGQQNTWAKDKAIMDDTTTNAQIQSAERISKDTLQNNVDLANISKDTEIEKIREQKIADKEILAESAKYQIAGTSTKTGKQYSVGDVISAKQKLEKEPDKMSANDYDALISVGYSFDSNGNVVQSAAEPTSNEKVNVFSFSDIDTTRIDSTNVDEYGKKMIEALKIEADKNGGILSEEEIYNFVVNNSDAYNCNLDQIQKVYSYLGIDKSILDNVKDAGFWFWDWGKGVKKKNKA